MSWRNYVEANSGVVYRKIRIAARLNDIFEFEVALWFMKPHKTEEIRMSKEASQEHVGFGPITVPQMMKGPP